MQNPRIKKAQKFLKSARKLLESGDYDSCVSRCYYALFHIAVALLGKINVRQVKWEHRFVLAEFNKEFIHRRKIFHPQISRTMEDIFYERMDADYDEAEMSPKKAKRMLDKAEAIFHIIFRELGNEKP